MSSEFLSLFGKGVVYWEKIAKGKKKVANHFQCSFFAFQVQELHALTIRFLT